MRRSDPDRRLPTAVRLAPAALAALVAVGCGGDDGGGDGGPPPATVEAALVESDSIPVRIRAVGSLESGARVVVRSEIAGKVEGVGFREGQAVDAGAVLLRLDDEKLRAEADAARGAVGRVRAEARNLDRRLERNRALLERGAISQQTFDDVESARDAARASLEEARARLALAEWRLADATVRAPFAGRAGERMVDPGDFVSPGGGLVEVVADDPLEMEFSVPERHLGRLAEGLEASVGVSGFPDRRFRGVVSFVSPVVDAGTRTVKLKAEIPNPEGLLRPGLFAEVALVLDVLPRALMVPEAAVVPGQRQTVIYRIRGGRARRRVVELGERRPGRVQVVSGLEAGDTVVVAGHQRLEDGRPVDVRMTAGPADPATNGGPAPDGSGAPEGGR